MEAVATLQKACVFAANLYNCNCADLIVNLQGAVQNTAKAIKACFGIFEPVVVKTANRSRLEKQAFLLLEFGFLVSGVMVRKSHQAVAGFDRKIAGATHKCRLKQRLSDLSESHFDSDFWRALT